MAMFEMLDEFEDDPDNFLDEMTFEDEFEGEGSGCSPTPRAGACYDIQRGDNLWTVARRALRSAGQSSSGTDIANYMKRINAVNPDQGRFYRRWSCADPRRRATTGERRCYYRLRLPPITEPDDPVVPGPPLPPVPNFPPVPNVPPVRPVKPIRTGPKLNACPSQHKNAIRRHWSDAVRNVVRAKARLNRLESMDPKQRRQAWNRKGGSEREWFGLYNQRGFTRVRRTFQRIHEYLVHTGLTVDCTNQTDSGFASVMCEARPRRIFLHSSWFNRSPRRTAKEWRIERTQTFVHEAAHCSGAERILFKFEVYSPERAKRFARRNPVGARRNAENYGYYAMSFE